MKKIFAVLLVLFFAVTIYPQQSPGKDHFKLNISCQTCHTCAVPTKNDPCLVICPREKIVTVYQKPEQTPELITIDQLSDRYGPVYFSHKIHAQMSNMGGGCSWGRGGGAVNSTMVSVSLRAYAGPRSFARPSRPATVTTCTLSASTHDDLPRRRPKMASSAAFGEGGGGSLMASSTPREKAARSGWRSARCRPGARGRSPA